MAGDGRSGPGALWTSAGVLALLGAALALFGFAGILRQGGQLADWSVALLVGYTLVAVGGALALAGRPAAAAWLILGGLAVGDVLARYLFGWYWPWAAFGGFGAHFDFAGPFWGLAGIASELAVWVVLASAVVSVVALARRSGPRPPA